MALRAELRRLLATFGAFLTLLVITTGMRRRALLAYDPELWVPPEQGAADARRVRATARPTDPTL
jgi:hypothetical protein